MYKFNIIQDSQGKIDQWKNIITNDSLIRYLQSPVKDEWICIYRKLEPNLNFFSTVTEITHCEDLKKRLPNYNGCSISDMVCGNKEAGCFEEYPLVYKRHRNASHLKLTNDFLMLNPILFDYHYDSIFLENESNPRKLVYLNSSGELKEFMIIEDDIAIMNSNSLNEFLARRDYLLAMYFTYTDYQIALNLKDPFKKKEHDGIIYYECRNNEALISMYGGKIIKPSSNDINHPQFVIGQNEFGQDIRKSLPEINKYTPIAFRKEALNRYQGECCKIEDKVISTPTFDLQITRSEDDRYFYVFVVHLLLIPVIEQIKLAEYSVSKNNATKISADDLEVISCGIPNNPSNFKYSFKLLYTQLSEYWKKKYGYELYDFSKSSKHMEKCLSEIDSASDIADLANNLHILLIEMLNTESLREDKLLNIKNLCTKNRGNNSEFYRPISNIGAKIPISVLYEQ